MAPKKNSASYYQLRKTIDGINKQLGLPAATRWLVIKKDGTRR